MITNIQIRIQYYTTQNQTSIKQMVAFLEDGNLLSNY